jgi:3-deoxy-D-manno-octulosonate 8-phosphate phosphatase (KDO 8-P phosphatase)
MRPGRAVLRKAAAIRLLILDVDGVLTDGGLYYSARGRLLKRFHAHDGYGVVRAREHGLRLAIISGRTSPVVAARARDLRITDVFQGIEDKRRAAAGLQEKYGLTFREIAFIGDDLFDLGLLRIVGLSAAPADALPDVRKAVDVVTHTRGGEGAVREIIDLIITAQSHRVRPRTDHGQLPATPAAQGTRPHRIRSSR